MSIGDAEHFVTEMFSTIVDGLKSDKQIIINGFGTFKQAEFGNKESIIFSPDEEMAQLINAPFANFKTVEITNSVFLAAEAEKEKAENAETEEEETENVEAGNADVSEGETAPDKEATTDVPVPEPQTSDSDNATSNDDVQPVEKQVEALTEKVDAITERLDSKRKSLRNVWISVAVVAAICLCGGGFYLWNQNRTSNEKTEMAEQQRQDSIKSAAIKQDSINNIQKNIERIDLTDEQKREIVGPGKPGAPEYPCEMTLVEAKKAAPHCAYVITGTREVYTVEAGKDMEFIGQEYGLQRGHFLIQVYNAIESVKEGQKIRIPLVEKK